MENKNIIIILLVIVAIILACILGAAFLPSMDAKKDSKIAIAANKTLYVGDDLTVKLTDLNKTPIKNGAVNVVVTDKNGEVVVNESVDTDSKGKAKVDLELDAGKYTVNATFAGNENFTGNTTSKKITVEEVVVEEEVSQPVEEESSSQSNEIYYDEEINVYYDSNGIVVDPDGEHSMEVGRPYSELAERREKWERGELVM